jgi:hypothetical protein
MRLLRTPDLQASLHRPKQGVGMFSRMGALQLVQQFTPGPPWLGQETDANFALFTGDYVLSRWRGSSPIIILFAMPLP